MSQVIATLPQALSRPATPARGPVAWRTPTTTASWPTSVPFTGSFVAIDPVTGRGTATLTVTNGATTNYSFYPVSSSELIMLGIDPVSGSAPLALFTLATATPQRLYQFARLNITTVAELQG